jgi:hypothetical protein
MMVTKDGDTLLTAQNLSQILSQGRDVYDTSSVSHYRTGQGKSYQNYRTTWLLCGTEALRQLDSTELGERFLDVVVMDEIDEELEQDINRRRFHSIINNRSMEVNGKLETSGDSAMIEAKQLTSGYMNYLRDNAVKLLHNVNVDPELSSVFSDKAIFTACMRARPSKKQDETEGREMSPRLLVQLTRFALTHAAVLGKDTIDKTVLSLTRKTALDTSRGRTLKLVKSLFAVGDTGAEARTISMWMNEVDDKTRKLLYFLWRIKIVERFASGAKGMSAKPRWRLTNKIKLLYNRVYNNIGVMV